MVIILIIIHLYNLHYAKANRCTEVKVIRWLWNGCPENAYVNKEIYEALNLKVGWCQNFWNQY